MSFSLRGTALADSMTLSEIGAGSRVIASEVEGPHCPAVVSPCHGTSDNAAAVWLVSESNEAGETVLHAASWAGHSSVVIALLGGGADVNIVDSSCSLARPLHEVRAVVRYMSAL